MGEGDASAGAGAVEGRRRCGEGTARKGREGDGTGGEAWRDEGGESRRGEGGSPLGRLRSGLAFIGNWVMGVMGMMDGGVNDGCSKAGANGWAGGMGYALFDL